jgi:hypothetical protein
MRYWWEFLNPPADVPLCIISGQLYIMHIIQGSAAACIWLYIWTLIITLTRLLKNISTRRVRAWTFKVRLKGHAKKQIIQPSDRFLKCKRLGCIILQPAARMQTWWHGSKIQCGSKIAMSAHRRMDRCQWQASESGLDADSHSNSHCGRVQTNTGAHHSNCIILFLQLAMMHRRIRTSCVNLREYSRHHVEH